ncbi:MAG: 2-phosphosulfolactate phosphatase [Chthoniobacter sp.]|jgi:2-phosphosulfolactate phosphatase|nr:2-phosphosulfolactate phosphatase [Chthoniobacter sp.]
MNIDVILSPPEIDLLPQRDLSTATVVVFDVLRATSSMITGLAHGMTEIFPARTIEEALELKTRRPDAKLGGERHGDRIEGFDLGNSPLEYRDLRGERIITTTTNGTVALRASEGAREVLVGALLNMNALVLHLQKEKPSELVLVCAGTFRELALEDVIAAGMLCARLSGSPSDSARVAEAVFRRHENDLLAALSSARNGRVLLGKNRGAEIEWCAQVSAFDVVGSLRDGVIRPLSARG